MLSGRGVAIEQFGQEDSLWEGPKWERAGRLCRVLKTNLIRERLLCTPSHPPACCGTRIWLCRYRKTPGQDPRDLGCGCHTAINCPSLTSLSLVFLLNKVRGRHHDS